MKNICLLVFMLLLGMTSHLQAQDVESLTIQVKQFDATLRDSKAHQQGNECADRKQKLKKEIASTTLYQLDSRKGVWILIKPLQSFLWDCVGYIGPDYAALSELNDSLTQLYNDLPDE